jgi:hypothetical protein
MPSGTTSSLHAGHVSSASECDGSTSDVSFEGNGAFEDAGDGAEELRTVERVDRLRPTMVSRAF